MSSPSALFIPRRPFGGSSWASCAVKRSGGVSREIRVILDPAKLQAQGITAAQVNDQLRLVNLYALITETLTLMEPEFRQHGIRVSLHEEGEWPYINADEVLMKQAVINILRNAIEAIVVQQNEIREARPGEVVISMVRDGDEVNLVFSDNGRGIDHEDLKHIFEPYFTTKPKGTGLGLMIVDRIIREHHGALSAHSEPGQGAQLAITLPVAAESPRLLEHGKSRPGAFPRGNE